jgi:hypothetical protein
VRESLLRARLHVEHDDIVKAHPFVVEEIVVYPSARPELRTVLPRRTGPEFLNGMGAAVLGILCRRIEPRIGPDTAQERETVEL